MHIFATSVLIRMSPQTREFVGGWGIPGSLSCWHCTFQFILLSFKLDDC